MSEDYNKLKEYIFTGRNVFLTGPGGVGKSFYINKLKEELKDDITVTSTTGVSAFNLKGQTIHSFSGIGAMKKRDRFDTIIKKVKKNKNAVQKILNCNLLVIDEISMLGISFLDMLDEIFKNIKKSQKVLGGIQVIFTGDFLQLPPIDDKFCFYSNVWQQLDLQIVYLQKMYRVKDPLYTGMLERIRVAKHTADDNKELYKRFFAYRNLTIDYSTLDIQPTFLYSKKVNVNEKNMEELEKNKNDLLVFKSNIIPGVKIPDDSEKYLYLKIGAQVMLTVNIDCEIGLVNGSRGIITNYDSASNTLFVKFLNNEEHSFSPHEFVYEEDGEILYKILQFPFILAYALSIHKVQGCTLDYAVIDIGHSVFEASMSYVALSRVRSLEGLFLEAYQPHKIFSHQDAIEFYENL